MTDAELWWPMKVNLKLNLQINWLKIQVCLIDTVPYWLVTSTNAANLLDVEPAGNVVLF